MILMTQAKAGVTCPMSMTYASMASLRSTPEIAEAWGPRLAAQAYDPRFIPAAEKDGVTIGMAMTEKQGGSDVRSNTTRAERTGDGGLCPVRAQVVLFGAHERRFFDARLCRGRPHLFPGAALAAGW